MSGRADGAPVVKPRVRLVGEDGNAFAILGRVRRALREAGASPGYVERYTREATSGDYDHLLLVTQRYVEEGDSDEEAEMHHYLAQLVDEDGRPTRLYLEARDRHHAEQLVESYIEHAREQWQQRKTLDVLEQAD